MIKLFTIIAITFYLSISVSAASGSLDRAFGTGGKATYTVGTASDNGEGSALQADGKLIVVGHQLSLLGDQDFLVLRYNTDGRLDSSFGTNGVVITSIGVTSDGASAVAIQPDGKIVVGGYSQSNGPTLVRYNVDGSLDQSFGMGGITSWTTGSVINEIAIDGDGKIIAVGQIYRSYSDFLIRRYNSDGTIDSTFGNGGDAVTGIRNGIANSVALQTDGKIVVVGNQYNASGTGTDLATIRVSSSGMPDWGFGNNGKVVTALGGLSYANAVAIGRGGAIFVAGRSAPQGKIAIVKYGSSGIPDRSFRGGGLTHADTGGVVTTSIGIARAVAVGTNGEVFVAGTVFVGQPNNTESFVVQKLNTDGSLARWGRGGEAHANFGTTFSHARSMTTDSHNIYVVGDHYNSITGRDIAIAKFLK